jgi:UDP-glucose 4-epimerase
VNITSKKILVTGGCGYIGSHIVRAFKQANPLNEVVVIDRVKRDHTLEYADGWFIDDFASSASLALIANKQFDVIVHCAGTSLVGPSVLDPADYWYNNVVKTVRMLDVLKELDNSTTIMFSSSASVYGEPQQLPIPETHKLGSINPYGNTKATVERLLRDYCIAYDMSSVCFRYFNAAGAAFDSTLGQEPGATHIIARALEASINDSEFVLYGDDYDTPDGTCIRDYVHVEDIALAHVQAADFLLKTSSATYHSRINRVYNLGTGQGISNREILQYIKDQYGLLPVVTAPRRPGDPAELVADPAKAREELNWVAKHSDIATIIDSAHRWYTRV